MLGRGFKITVTVLVPIIALRVLYLITAIATVPVTAIATVVVDNRGKNAIQNIS
jgi:hypothetical protein